MRLIFVSLLFLSSCAVLQKSQTQTFAPNEVLNSQNLRETLIAQVPSFRACYQNVLDRSERAFEAMIELNFAIGPTGSVIKALVTPLSVSVPESVRDCTQNVLKATKFPPPSNGEIAQVKQKINFSLNSDNE